MKKVQLAKNLPDSPQMTEEELEECDRLAQEWSRIVAEDTKGMEQITAEDLAVVIRRRGGMAFYGV